MPSKYDEYRQIKKCEFTFVCSNGDLYLKKAAPQFRNFLLDLSMKDSDEVIHTKYRTQIMKLILFEMDERHTKATQMIRSNSGCKYIIDLVRAAREFRTIKVEKLCVRFMIRRPQMQYRNIDLELGLGIKVDLMISIFKKESHLPREFLEEFFVTILDMELTQQCYERLKELDAIQNIATAEPISDLELWQMEFAYAVNLKFDNTRKL